MFHSNKFLPSDQICKFAEFDKRHSLIRKLLTTSTHPTLLLQVSGVASVSTSLKMLCAVSRHRHDQYTWCGLLVPSLATREDRRGRAMQRQHQGQSVDEAWLGQASSADTRFTNGHGRRRHSRQYGARPSDPSLIPLL